MKNSKKMKKVLLPAMAACFLTLLLAVNAMADLVPALSDYHVEFTSANKMSSNFKTSDMYLQASGLQPGDYTDIAIKLTNQNETTVDWYMTNEVLKSLEDTRDNDELKGGAYTYILTFKNTTSGEEKTLFSSDVVGGEEVSQAGEGLHEATSALQKDWLYLDTFA